MSETDDSPQIALRIPGDWSHPGQLLDRLPDGFRMTPEAMVLPDGAEIELNPLPPDKVFPQIFQTSCRRPPTDEELAIVCRYTVNIGLCGPGGSMDAARTMMQAGAAIVRAGGAGVFIDNSGLAHGGDDWLRMTDDGSTDAISFAYVSIVRGRHEMYTMGMHVMGFADVLMRYSDSDGDEHEEAIVELVRYICGGGKPIDVDHLLADENGPRYQVLAVADNDADVPGPMRNPHGRLRIASMKDIAEGN
jgi:hypothetical protein